MAAGCRGFRVLMSNGFGVRRFVAAFFFFPLYRSCGGNITKNKSGGKAPRSK